MNDGVSLNVKLSKLDEEIVQFDCVLDRIQKLLPEDMKVYRLVVKTRDAMFRLHNQIHECDIVRFTEGGAS